MNKNLLLFLLIMSCISFAEEKPFNDHKKVKKVFLEYIKAVDAKDINKMADYFYYGDSDKTVFHFGDNPPLAIYTKVELMEILSAWKESPRSNFSTTRFDKIDIVPRWDHANAIICTIDAVYSRLNEDGDVINKARTLYHLYRYKNTGVLRFLNKWKPWKIYMVLDLDLES